MSELNVGQLRFIVERAQRDGRLNDRVIEGYLRELQDEIRDVEDRLQMLRGVASQQPSAPARPQNARRRVSSPRKAQSAGNERGRASAKNAASQQIQGRYIAYLRQLPKKERPKFQEMARSEGRETAIEAIRKTLGR